MAEKIEGLSIGLDLDTLKVDSGMTDLRSKLRLVNSEMKANLSAFDKGDKSLEKYQTTLNGLNKKIEVQRAITEKAYTTYQKMVKEYGEGSKEADKAANHYNNQSASLNNLQRAANRTENELKELQQELNKSEFSWTNLGQTIQNTGRTLTGIGSSLTVGLTTPILGAGLAIGKVASDFDEATGRIEARLGVTKQRAEELSEVAQDVWKNGFGESVREASDAITVVNNNLKDLSDEQLKEATSSAFLLQEAFDAELNESTRAAGQLMKDFGEDSSKAFDLLTWGFQNGLDYTGEFLDTIREYSPQFAEMGYTSEQMLNALKDGFDAGSWSLDKLGDSIKESHLRMTDMSKATKDAYKALGLSAEEYAGKIAKGGKEGNKAFQEVVKKLQGVEDATERNLLATDLFGTQYEDLREKVIFSMTGASKSIEGLEGTTKRASDAIQDNFGTRITKIWRDFVTDLEPAGDILLDLAEDILPKVANTVDSVTNAFAEMDPKTQKTVLALGGIAAAAGPVLMGIGGLTTGIGGLIKLVGPLLPMIGGTAGLSGVFAGLAGPIGWTTLALGGLGVGFDLLDKEMDKPIIKSDIFKGKISEATKEAVGSYMELDEQATAELNSLAWSQATITDQMANNMVTKYQQMGDQVLLAMQENHTKQLEEQQRLFDQSNILSEEEEAKRLAKLKADQLGEIETLNEHQAKIKEIWTLAAEEKRGITDAEAQEIALLQEQMRAKAVEELSASQQEQLTILNNMKEQKGIIEAETAANTVNKSVETKNKVVSEAQQEYNQKIATIEHGRDVVGNIKTQEADAMIQEAERARDKTIANAEDTHMEVVRAAQAQAEGHIDEVNWETGEVLSGWDKMYNGIIDAVNWIRELFGMEPLEKKGSVKENDRQKLKRQNAEIKGYADGTSSNGHPGGPAIVGEEGRELAFIPGRGVTLLGTRGPEFHSNLPRGTSVLPNKQTESMLKSFGFPGYAEGIGDYFNLFLDGAGAVWDFVKDKFSLSKISFPSWIKEHTGNPLDMIGKFATDWIKDTWDSWFGDIGSSSVGSTGVQKWAGIAAQALMMTNQYSQANLDRLLYQMQTESGGNPMAINLWDINAQRGTPSKGLMQVIDPTFKAYAMPGYNTDIFDPLSNILASIRYAVSRYGSLEKAYRGVGYEVGGVIKDEQLAMIGEGNKEEVIIPMEKHRNRALDLFAYAGGKLGVFDELKGTFKEVTSLINNGIERVILSIDDHKNSLLYKMDELIGMFSYTSSYNSIWEEQVMKLRATIKNSPLDDDSFEINSLLSYKPGYIQAEDGSWVPPSFYSQPTDAMKILAVAGKQITNNNRPNQLPNVSPNIESNGLLQAVLEQNKILMALLQSSRNIEKKPALTENDIGLAVDNYNANQTIKNNIYSGRPAY